MEVSRPVGALSEVERRKLMHRYGPLVTAKNDRTYYSVERDGNMRASNKYCFSWGPEVAYYFDNYWHAWAYHLQLKGKK